jgi:pSer/pThr/pTyr-binding forkhead associated (FHA) protein
MYKLVISDDEGKTTVVPLVREEITIGRKEGNTIRLTERNVSRRHARLVKQDGAFVVEDLGSYNGVKLNGRRIDGPAKLRAEDHITIGDYQLALKEQVAETAASEHEQAEPAAPEAPSEPQPPPRLVMLTPPAPGAEFALSKEKVRLGRAEDLDVWVNHRSISREHAEVVRDGEGFKIVDLGSANGVRVNGEDATERTLEPGDMLELGQVRFRYVGEGEQYVFDADQTVQMGALEGESQRSRLPMVAGVLIVAAAVAAAALIIISPEQSGGESSELVGDGETHQVSSAPPGDSKQADQEGDSDKADMESRQVAVATAVDNCRKHLEAGRYDKAVEQASRALSWEPEHQSARKCKKQAESRRSEQDAFERGRQALKSEDVDTAYFAFKELPEDSKYRDRPEVDRARRGYAQRQLQEGRELVRSNPMEAKRRADKVLQMQGLPRELTRQARRLRQLSRRMRQRLASRSVATVRSNGDGQGGGTARQGSSSSSDGSTQGAGEGSSSGSAGSGSAGSGSGGGSPLSGARECLATGKGNSCVVRALEGRARTADGLALLIETYRTMGNTPAMRRTMKQFISRFPNDRRARSYKRQMEP